MIHLLEVSHMHYGFALIYFSLSLLFCADWISLSMPLLICISLSLTTCNTNVGGKNNQFKPEKKNDRMIKKNQQWTVLLTYSFAFSVAKSQTRPISTVEGGCFIVLCCVYL